MSFAATLPVHLRPRREKLFGDGRPRLLDRNAKVRIMTFARALMRRAEKGKAYGAITAKALAVLEALLWGFHNAKSGLCFPSYERIAEASRDLFGYRIRKTRVIRTSNGYHFIDPQPSKKPKSFANSSKSDFPSGTPIQKSFLLGVTTRKCSECTTSGTLGELRPPVEIAANILPQHLPPQNDSGGQRLEAPLIAMLDSPARAVEGAIGSVLSAEHALSPFPKLWQHLELKLLTASGINPERPSSRQPVTPTKAKDKEASALISDYLAGTPLAAYFETRVPFSMPFAARFEHMHVVGGSGHGKTQLLQSLILRDIEKLLSGKGSIVVIDSQGDMIRTILGLASKTG